MKWFGGRESDNVESGSGGFGGRIVGGGIGTLVIGIIVYLLGGRSSDVQVLQQAASGGSNNASVCTGMKVVTIPSRTFAL